MTIERLLEVEVVDSFEKALEYDKWDRRETNERFVDDLLALGPIVGDVLDIGTGTALIPIELCRRNDDVRVMAIDDSWQMLDQARINIELEGLIESIMLDLVDAKDLSIYEDGQFHVVMSNHTLHQFATPETVLTGAFRVTASAGQIFFRDWLRPADEATVKHLVQTYAGQENGRRQQEFENSLRAALSLEEVREAVRYLGGDSAQVTATSDRDWTWSQQKEPA